MSPPRGEERPRQRNLRGSSLSTMRVERPLDRRNQSGKVRGMLSLIPGARAKAALPRLVVCGTRASRGSRSLTSNLLLQEIKKYGKSGGS